MNVGVLEVGLLDAGLGGSRHDVVTEGGSFEAGSQRFQRCHTGSVILSHSSELLLQADFEWGMLETTHTLVALSALVARVEQLVA